MSTASRKAILNQKKNRPRCRVYQKYWTLIQNNGKCIVIFRDDTKFKENQVIQFECKKQGDLSFILERHKHLLHNWDGFYAENCDDCMYRMFLLKEENKTCVRCMIKRLHSNHRTLFQKG